MQEGRQGAPGSHGRGKLFERSNSSAGGGESEVNKRVSAAFVLRKSCCIAFAEGREGEWES